MAIGLGVSFYFTVFDELGLHSLWAAWIIFGLKIGACSFLVTLQLLTLNSIKTLIVNTVDCKPKNLEFVEHIYIFVFFAIIVIIQSIYNLIFQHYGHHVETSLEQTLWRISFVCLGLLYTLANIFYMSIISSIWSYKTEEVHECPILGMQVPLVVYIINRRLLRQKNTTWHEEDKKKIVARKPLFTYEKKVVFNSVEKTPPYDKDVKELLLSYDNKQHSLESSGQGKASLRSSAIHSSV